MHKNALFAATLSIVTLGVATVSTPARAQDASTTTAQTPGGTMPDKPMVTPDPATGKPVVVVPMGANAADQYKSTWAYRNLDEREVRRYRAAGFSDTTIKGAANIALRTGLTIDYVLRRVREVGEPLSSVALQHNVTTQQLTEDIPGYGMETISVMTAPSTPSGSTTMPRTGMTTGSMTSSSSSASLPGSIPSASSAAASGTIADIAMGNPDFSTLVTALRAAGLADMLRGAGPYTVFAPTNAAFAKLPAGAVDNLMKPENREQLRSVLQYHVLPGRIMAADVMAMSNPSTPRTAGGATLNIKTTAPIMVNDANVSATDIVASNGVIHVIDTVLMPASASGDASSASTPAPPATTDPAPPATDPAAPATDPAAPATPATPATP